MDDIRKELEREENQRIGIAFEKGKFLCETADLEQDSPSNGLGIPGTGCGEIDHVTFDGYHIAEKLLEGCTIKVTIENGNYITDISDCLWSDMLSEKEIKVRADNYCTQLDIGTCPKCNNDIGFLE